jgi:hypothetical protein
LFVFLVYFRESNAIFNKPRRQTKKCSIQNAEQTVTISLAKNFVLDVNSISFPPSINISTFRKTKYAIQLSTDLPPQTSRLATAALF